MNKNNILISGVVVAIGILAIAQTGNAELITGMMGYKMAKSYHPGFILGLAVLKLLAIALVSFIFSTVFWYTHKGVMKKK
jgi:hypothetical protein